MSTLDTTSAKKKEKELFERFKVQQDLEAKKELLKSLDPLINHQVNRFATSGLPSVAIKLEAQRLTANAIDTYDPNKAQLNTHVINNLKKLSRFVTNYQNVGHIPEPRALMIGKYQSIYSNLETDKGREPTIDEIADQMSVGVAEIERLQTELRKDLSSTTFLEDDGDEDAEGFFQYVETGAIDPRLKEAIEFVYFDSDPIDKKILDYTLGLHGFMRRKAKDIGTLLNLSDNELKKRKLALAKEIDILR